MQSSDLVELAVCLASHGGAMVRCANQFCDRSVERYWTSSRCRLDRWSRSIRSFSKSCERRSGPPDCNDATWLDQRAQLREIIASDVLTRVWLGISSAIDQRGNNDQLEPTARSIFVGQLEVRNRALRLLRDPLAISHSEAESLNRLRCRSERWTDLLIGRLLAQQVGDIADAAYHADRAKAFAEDLAHDHQRSPNNLAWRILASSIQNSMAGGFDSPSVNADLNADIATSILACFPADMFDSVGQVKSLWQVRLTHFTDDAAGLLDDILHLDEEGQDAFWYDRPCAPQRFLSDRRNEY